MKKAALYVRVSTLHQIDKDSLPLQREELAKYAEYALGIKDYVVFEDAGYSGKNTDRPQFIQMMNRIRSGEFTHLLVWKIDRISRNLIDFANMYEELKSYGVTFVSKNEQFDTGSAMGEAMLKIILVFAELERKLAAERVYATMLSRAEKGLWNGANVPLGYQWDSTKKFPVPHPDESETIKIIFTLYEKTKSTTKVAMHLTDKGLKTKRGGLWGTKSITDIVRNPFYKGTYRYNYKESARGKTKDESEWIVIDDNHEAIISKELWGRCNSIMDENALRNSSLYRKVQHVHLFSQKIECGNCGSVFIASKDRQRADGYTPSRYRCKRKINNCVARIITETTLAPLFINFIANIIKAQQAFSTGQVSHQALKEILLQGEIFEKLAIKDVKGIDALIDSFNSIDLVYELSSKPALPETPADLAAFEKERKKTLTAIERLEDLYLFSEAPIAEKDYILRRKKLLASLEDVEAKIKKASTAPKNYGDNFLVKSSQFIIANELSNKPYIDYKELEQSVEKSTIKSFVQSIVEKIVVQDGKVQEIYFVNGVVCGFEY